MNLYYHPLYYIPIKLPSDLYTNIEVPLALDVFTICVALQTNHFYHT